MDAMSLEKPNTGLVKIQVPLLGSARESGFESESVWAEPLGGRLYRIWNLPVFAYNLDMRAVVECESDPKGGLPIATRVVEPGDCYVVRLYFDVNATEEQINQVLALLSERRALFEKYSDRLWAVGLRSLDDYEWVGPALASFTEDGLVTLESGLQSDEPVLGGAA